MASILDSLAGSDDIEYNSTKMPVQNRQFLDSYMDRTLGTKDRVQQGLDQAVNSTQNTYTPYDMNMSAALTNKYQHSLNRGMEGVKAKNLLTPYTQSANALGQASALASHRSQMEQDNLKRMRDAGLAREQARSQVLGSLLGLGFAGGAAASRASGSKKEENITTGAKMQNQSADRYGGGQDYGSYA